jgi:hypothetical protein
VRVSDFVVALGAGSAAACPAVRAGGVVAEPCLPAEALAEGRSNAGIAQALVVTESAVAQRINDIFAKLGLPPDDADHRRVLAALRFLKLG